MSATTAEALRATETARRGPGDTTGLEGRQRPPGALESARPAASTAIRSVSVAAAPSDVPSTPPPARSANGRFATQPGGRPTPRPLRIGGPASPAWDLAPRHVNLLDLTADGVPRYEIARRLDISPNTLADWFKSAARILGTGNRTAMVAECYLAGVFTPNRAGGPVPDVGAHRLPLVPLLARGFSYAEMAAELGVEESVVKHQVRVIYQALGAVGGVHVPRRAVDLGLLTAGLELAPPTVPAASKPSRSALSKRVATPAAKPAPEPAPEPAPVSNPLSPIEERVLRLLAFGFELDAIATRLKIGPGAVRENARSAMAKMGARTLPNAVFLACGAGILAGPGGGRNG